MQTKKLLRQKHYYLRNIYINNIKTKIIRKFYKFHLYLVVSNNRHQLTKISITPYLIHYLVQKQY